MDDLAAANLCPDQLSNNACEGPPCSYEHDFRLCHPCGVIVRPARSYNSHAATLDHNDRVRGNFVRCPVCTTCFVRGNWSAHVRGAGHVKKANSRGLKVKVEPEIPASVPGHQRCIPCNLFIQSEHFHNHQKRVEHVQKAQFRQRIANYIANTQMESENLNNAIQVDHPDGIDFGLVDEDGVRRGTVRHLVVSTTLQTPRIHLIEPKITQASTKTSAFTAKSQGISLVIKPGVDFHVVVCFNPTPRHVGHHTARVKLRFRDIETNKEFSIPRALCAIYGDSTDQEQLRPSAPFVPKARRSRPAWKNVVWADRPARYIRNPYKIKLGHYPIPKELLVALDHAPHDVGKVIASLPTAHRPQTLDQKTYTKSMSALLWIEEHRALIDIQIYDMDNVRLRKQGGRYLLDVPGLAENRPSVILGDGILVQAEGSADEKSFEGLVVDVRSMEVALQFHGSFTGWTATRGYSIKFNFNRYPLRRQHQALHCPFNEDRVFFPLLKHVKQLSAYTTSIRLHNTLIGGNPAQLLAIRAILRLPPGSHPFVIYGPPGTGKTSTCVEAILQLLDAQPGTRIFACAPSNSAADVLASRLLETLSSTDLYRFYAPSRATSKAPAQVLPCTTLAPDGSFAVPTLDHVLRFRVVISTCGSASFAHGIEVPAGHFSHIFIDEAGQATEPEVMVPIKTMADSRTNVILSGDPKQLGPIIRSPIAKELGLGKSFLERMMERQVYDETTGHGRTIVKLVKNFRSHPDILYFPNQVFYAGDLRPHGRTDIINAYAQWSNLPKKNFPVIFHAVAGEDKREASSPSYFNIDEITQAKTYVKLLLEDRTIPIEAKDIGVITPYHAQAMKTRIAFRSMTPSAEDVQVASVELFQGQERRVIIMSTVRSTQDMMAYDLRHTLGFVSNPRRFNVAVTRAQALLIVIGNPAVLGLDPLWRDFLNWIYARGGWAGPPPSWDALAEARDKEGEVATLGLRDINTFAQRMETLRLDATSDDEEPDEDGWRAEE